MPSPRFGERVMVDAIALAVREAWHCADKTRRPAVLSLALRRILGGDRAGKAMGPALQILNAEGPPLGRDVEPPEGCDMTLCVRCREVRVKESRAVPKFASASLGYLRNKKWLERQVEVLHLSDQEIAANLRCCKQSVMNWRRFHGIRAPKEAQVHLQEAWLRQKLVDERLAPGEVGALAGVGAADIKQHARRFGIEIGRLGDGKNASGMWAHHYREWWVERLSRDPQPTQYALAKMAGIATHAVLYHLRKWDLFNPDSVSKRRESKHTQLYVPGWLQEQLQTKSYVEIAAAIGCQPGNVQYAVKKMRLADPTRKAGLPRPWIHDPEWYRSRYPARPTIEQLAAEAGVKPKSIENFIRELGLTREYHDRVGRWSDAALRKTRERTVARQARALAAVAG